MANNNTVNMPAGFGGLTRFDAEYPSRFNPSPGQIMGFIVAIVIFRILLGVFL